MLFTTLQFQVIGYFIVVTPLLVTAFATTAAFALVFVALGPWPSLLCTVEITALSVITLPVNIYTHLLVTYRTVMLRPTLKLINVILCPVLLLTPVATFLFCLVQFGGLYLARSFVGFPILPWKEVLKKNEEERCKKIELMRCLNISFLVRRSVLVRALEIFYEKPKQFR